MVYRAPANLACVACDRTMSRGEISAVGYLRCDLCAGVWIEELALGQLLGKSERAPSIKTLSEGSEASTRRPCPLCRDPMQLTSLGSLQLDRCPRHGIWLDKEELQRAMVGNTGPEPEAPEPPEAALLRALLSDMGE